MEESIFPTVRTFAHEIADAVRATKRLLQMAADLRTRASEDATPGSGLIQFDMTVWGAHVGDHHPTEQNHCGTAACALGTAALNPAFNAEGLIATWVPDGYRPLYNERGENTGEVKRWRMHITLHNDRLRFTPNDMGAGRIFFGLTEKESRDLFGGTGRSRPAVIRRIQHYAKHRQQLKDLREAGVDFI